MAEDSAASLSYYGYRPDVAANAVGCALFFVILILQLILGLVARDWWMFVTWGLAAGLELAGYIGRLCSHYYLSNVSLYEMQMICCIFAPAFMAAGLYYQLGKQVTIYGHQYSVFKPMIYTAIFTTCDVISLFVQAAGGGLASSGNDQSQQKKVGRWIIVAGIVFQVVILAIFSILYALVNWRIFKDDPKNWTPEFAHTRKRPLFPYLMPAVSVSLLFLLIRSIYRIVELSEGWNGYLMQTERYFLICDGLMIVIGMIPICIIYPGLAYGYVPVEGLHYKGIDRHKTKNQLPEEKQDAENFKYSGNSDSSTQKEARSELGEPNV